MELRIKKVNISSGGPLIVIIHKEDAKKLDLKEFRLKRININLLLNIFNNICKCRPCY